MQKLILLFFIFLLSACKGQHSQYNGYFDADLTYLSSDFAGRLDELLVKRGQSVGKNQLLFKLEQTNEKFGVDTSQLNQKYLLEQRKVTLAQIHYNEINYQRTLKIRTQDAASQNDLDLAKEQLDVLRNQLAAIDFQIQSSHVDTADKKWIVARKSNSAPEPGIIFDTYFTQNEYVQGGQPVLSLITKHNIKVIFFASEKDLDHIKLGQAVKISTDDNPESAIGRISYIANIAQYTPPIIYSREQRGKLVFRIEARIDKPNLEKLHLGQPVSIELIP